MAAHFYDYVVTLSYEYYSMQKIWDSVNTYLIALAKKCTALANYALWLCLRNTLPCEGLDKLFQNIAKKI